VAGVTAANGVRPTGSVRVTPDAASGDDVEPMTVEASAGEVKDGRDGEVSVRLADGRIERALVGRRANGREAEVEVTIDGWRFAFRVEDASRASLRERASRVAGAAAGAGPTSIRTPIPGRVVSVAVAPGDAVSAGQPLLVVEAMKMQNDVRAPRAGTIARVDVAAGQAVDAGDVLVVIE
jgi:biotin carboxyl carrier protein